MNKIIATFVIIIATVAQAGYWMPAGRHHDVHFVEDTPRHSIVGANVLGIGFDITVPGRRTREVVSVAPVQGAVTVQAPTTSYSYVPTEGKVVTTVYPNGMTVTEAPVAPAPIVVTERVWVPGHYETRYAFGRVYQHYVTGRYELRQRVVHQ